MVKMKKIILVFVAVSGLAVIALSTQALARTLIKDTRHNLSSWGKYTVKAATETQVCIFCHAPHNADSTQAPLWSHKDTTATFQMASTVNVVPGRRTWADAQPTGISKKCLSCHDGTVAIGALAGSSEIAVTGASGSIAPGVNNALAGSRTPGGGLTSGDYGYIGTDLRGGHVISFKYKDAIDFFDSARIKFNDLVVSDRNSMLDRQGKMQCHTCHDPHNDWCSDPAKTIGRDPLWRKACGTNGNADLCLLCHKTMTGFKNYSF